MTLYQNKYRVESTRLAHWDYGSNASYFVTICTHQRLHFFGEVVNDQMHLSEIGQWAHNCWAEIPAHFPYVKLDAYVVMPNHVHGIIIIDKPDGRDMEHVVKVQNFAPPPIPPSSKNKFGPQSQNLASIIRGYKAGVTKNARAIHADFAWQSRFHDHIIRNERSFQAIRQYIQTNPERWHCNKFHS